MPQNAIVFVGNSITDMHPWIEAFGNDPRIVNRGCSGAVSSEILENMDGWLSAKPSKVFLMIGTNDLGWDSTAESVVKNITTIVTRIREESPSTEIYLQSVLPARDQRNRSLKTICEVNERLNFLAENTENTTYINLYNKLIGIIDREPFSLDQLHLEAFGYKVWCETIAPWVGIPCIYPSSTKVEQQTGELAAANGMRASYFSMLPIESEDILFLGDEMVKCGEWNELLHNPHLKNRGTGWGYGGDIATTSKMIEVTLRSPYASQRATQPKKIIIYTGTDDILASKPIEEIEQDYQKMVERVKELTPKCDIAIVGLLPRNDGNKNVSAFNNWLKRYASQDERLTFISTEKMANSKGVAKKQFIQNNYLYSKGYQVLAKELSGFVNK